MAVAALFYDKVLIIIGKMLVTKKLRKWLGLHFIAKKFQKRLITSVVDYQRGDF